MKLKKYPEVDQSPELRKVAVNPLWGRIEEGRKEGEHGVSEAQLG